MFKEVFIDLYESNQDKKIKAAIGVILLFFNDKRAHSEIERVVREQNDFELIEGYFNGFESVETEVFIPYLINIAKISNRRMRDRAVSLLARFENDEILDYLYSLLDAEEQGIQRSAVSIIGKWSSQGNKKAMRKAL